MNLKILLPAGILLNEQVNKVIAEAVNGSFCLLPRHIDFLDKRLIQKAGSGRLSLS